MFASCPWPALEACTEACAAFRRFPRVDWSDYGMCHHLDTPRRGFPVLVGRECPYATRVIGWRETR